MVNIFIKLILYKYIKKNFKEKGYLLKLGHI